MAAPPTTWSYYDNHNVGDIATWANMYDWFFCNLPNFGDYYMTSWSAHIHRNTYIAINLLVDKCNAMQVQIDGMADGISMEKILLAMLSANPAEIEYFVGLVDAYRQSLWNKPFNVTLFAEYARAFEQWP